MFIQSLSPDLTNCLPFIWNNFKTSVSYTYRLNDLSDLEEVYKGFRTSVRTDIKKAEKLVTVTDDVPYDEVLRLVKLTYSRQNKQVPYPISILENIFHTAIERKQGKVFGAIDGTNQYHAIIFLTNGWFLVSSFNDG